MSNRITHFEKAVNATENSKPVLWTENQSLLRLIQDIWMEDRVGGTILEAFCLKATQTKRHDATQQDSTKLYLCSHSGRTRQEITRTVSVERMIDLKPLFNKNMYMYCQSIWWSTRFKIRPRSLFLGGKDLHRNKNDCEKEVRQNFSTSSGDNRIKFFLIIVEKKKTHPKNL